MIVFNANEQPTSFKYQQTSLTFHVTGFRESIGGGIGYCIDRIIEEGCWGSSFWIDISNGWVIGSGWRFFLFLFDGDKIFNVAGGDKLRFLVGIRERLDSK